MVGVVITQGGGEEREEGRLGRALRATLLQTALTQVLEKHSEDGWPGLWQLRKGCHQRKGAVKCTRRFLDSREEGGVLRTARGGLEVMRRKGDFPSLGPRVLT